MSSLLYRLGRWCATRAGRTLLAWIAILVVLGACVGALGVNLTASFAINDVESMRGLAVLAERVPQAAGVSERVLFTSADAPIEQHRAAIDAFVQGVRQIDGVALVGDPFAEGSTAVSPDSRHALVEIQTDTSVGSVVSGPTGRAEEVAGQIASLRERAAAQDPGLISMTSDSLELETGIALSATELLGVLIAVIVLLGTFKSLTTAGAPIVSALIGVGTGMLAILVAAALVDVNSVTPVLAVMIGLAVGIDYALFIIARSREYLVRGIAPAEAAARANATAGSAVVFAGATVVVALCGLAVARIPFLAVMGFASAGVVVIAVLVAITATPALLGLLGERARPRRRRAARDDHPVASRWIAAITRVPTLTVLAVIAVLGAAAVPVTGLRLGLPDNGYHAVGSEARTTYDAIADAYGEGYNAPIIVMGDISQSKDPVGAVDSLAERLRALRGVADIPLATPNQDGTLALVRIRPEKGQTDASTTALVNAIRSDAASIEDGLGVRALMVTGSTAVAIDIAAQLGDAMLPFGTVVVGLSMLLLMIVFRSIVVPVTATLGYLLSLGAGLGAVGLVFGWGWMAGPLGVSRVGIVISFLPVIAMGVLFGLAMDYQVFLVSRMREEWIRTGDARESVRKGFIGSSQVITAAAAIMIGVFAAFIGSESIQIKPIAVALTVGVLADALLVRMTLIPALMALLGRAAWWLPRWLDALLPIVDVEGEGLDRSLEHAAWMEAHGAAALRLEGVTVSEGRDTAFRDLSVVVRPGALAVVRSDDAVARRAFAALVGARLRPTRGRVVVVGHVLPDGTSSVQRQTAALKTHDEALPDHARIVVVDDPGARRWGRVARLLDEGRTVVVTGPTGLVVPVPLRAATDTPLATSAPAVGAGPAPNA